MIYILLLALVYSVLACASEVEGVPSEVTPDCIQLTMRYWNSSEMYFSWSSHADRVYRVQYKADLTTSPWTNILGDSITVWWCYGPGKWVAIKDRGSGFYRVIDVGSITNAKQSYFADDPNDGVLERVFDTCYMEFAIDYTNKVFTTLSGITLQQQQYNFWTATDGLSSGDRVADLSRLLNDLIADDRIYYAYPVYIPAGRGYSMSSQSSYDPYVSVTLNVQTLDQIDDLLSRLKLQYISGPNSGIYILLLLQPKVDHPLAVCSALRHDARIKWAEPRACYYVDLRYPCP